MRNNFCRGATIGLLCVGHFLFSVFRRQRPDDHAQPNPELRTCVAHAATTLAILTPFVSAAITPKVS